MLARTKLSAEWRPLAGLGGIAAEWRVLADNAAEPNVFYEPSFALAAAPVLGRHAGAVLIWSAAPRRLLGLFPARLERRYGPGPRVLTGWTHPYAPLGTPLIDRDASLAVVATFLEHVANDRALPKLLLMPDFGEEGPVAAAFDAAVTERGAVAVRTEMHRRALLAPGDRRAGYLDAALSTKRRKNFDRQYRRLAESGQLSFTLTEDAGSAVRLLDEFFTLEASGWKGRARTAAQQSPPIREFMQSAVSGLAAQGKARIGRLACGDHAIAMGILLTSGRGSWFWKVAYDENFAHASPGVQLTLLQTKSLLADESVDWCDSCAVADHPMIDHIWRERRLVSARLIALRPGMSFDLARRLEALRRGALETARHARDLVR
jgi:CelD/BcsL family acetyltransferase involved in cellulose biosynthesis